MTETGAVSNKPVITFFDESDESTRVAERERAQPPFTGLARFADETTSRLVVQMTTESRTGEIAGTILVDVGGKGKESHLYLFRGTSRRRMFALQALATGNRTAMLSGSVTQDGKRVIGTFVATEPGRVRSDGTFEVSRD
jgi:hypothetical protein